MPARKLRSGGSVSGSPAAARCSSPPHSRFTPALVQQGLVIAVLIGMVGGFLPALRAARQPVTTALRAA